MTPNICYLFSKNKKFGSWVIRVGTFWEAKLPFNNTPSHVAVLINDRWVVESVVSDGFRVIPYKKWLKLNDQILKIPTTSNLTMQQIKDMYRPLKGLRYDWTGVLYLSWRLGLKLVFGWELPTKNAWQCPNTYFCSEVVAKLNGVSYSMTTPARIMKTVLTKSIENG